MFVICGVGSFIPITLEQLGKFIGYHLQPPILTISARERGVLLSDRAVSCNAGLKASTPADFPETTLLNEAAKALYPRADKGQCIINFFGTDINTASFAMYTFSVSVLLQALLIISMSGAADHGRYRKSLLLSFAFIGAVATMLFLAIIPKIYALGALLAIISNTCFGASFVLLNSFLPVLVRRHPSIQATVVDRISYSQGSSSAQTVEREDQGHDSATESLLQSSSVARRMIPDQVSSAAVSPALRLSTKISSYGIGIGYIAAVIVQALGIAIVLVADSMKTSTTLTLRIVLFLVGLWWFIFTIPAALWLRPRPGPPLPSTNKGKGNQRSWVGYVGYAWHSLGKTILRVRRLKDVMLFLGAWLLLSDGIATVSGTAVLFAKTELQMTPAALALISLVGTVAGILGAFGWSKFVRTVGLTLRHVSAQGCKTCFAHLQRSEGYFDYPLWAQDLTCFLEGLVLISRFQLQSQWLGIPPSKTIMACICLFEFIPIYGLLGYIPAIKRFGVFGLQVCTYWKACFLFLRCLIGSSCHDFFD